MKNVHRYELEFPSLMPGLLHTYYIDLDIAAYQFIVLQSCTHLRPY